jgi:hypothetical protein
MQPVSGTAGKGRVQKVTGETRKNGKRRISTYLVVTFPVPGEQGFGAKLAAAVLTGAGQRAGGDTVAAVFFSCCSFPCSVGGRGCQRTSWTRRQNGSYGRHDHVIHEYQLQCQSTSYGARRRYQQRYADYQLFRAQN